MKEDYRRIYYREDVEYVHSRLTIERKLQMYEKHPDRSERAATLWHAWHQNKRWLIRLLELTLASFPSYSRHDASHADAVLQNIERVLGENRIAQLSATDCFAILHTVYVHDIGMAILAADREMIVKSDEFVEMIDILSEGADKDLRKAALQLKKNTYQEEADEEIDYDGIEYHDNKKRLYSEKLETYYAVVQLLAEYQRKHHGEKAASNVKDWIRDGDKLRSEFAMSGIPMRIFFRIADCAYLHTDWDFQHIMDLPSEEDGYENDMLHPRFVAVLLQLGDALDIDNDRFHPFAHAFSGDFPMQSQAHYDKHLAIRTLKITPEKIMIEADCETREAMRLIKNECDGIDNLLKSASYYWSRIAPKGFSGALPSFQLSRLLLKGKEIPWDLALTRFQISQQKAFSFLQGENIYSGYFPFVRELLQNAIDSTKLQCYEDYKTSSKFRFADGRKTKNKPGITNISTIINPAEYPIEISIQCCKLNRDDEWEEIDWRDIPDHGNEKEKYGVLFSIKDYGTGINTDTLRNISNVGTSYKSRKKLLREVPEWLRPTGEFGIGLQSVFLVSDNFFCETYVRNGERYRIEFRTGANGENGYINVIPKDPYRDPMAFGTEFQVFINHERKRTRTECKDAWTGYDPFSDEYENSQIKRDIIELTIQILLDIDKQLEDLFFPIYASVKFDLGNEQRELLNSKLSKVVFSNLEEGDNYTEENLKKHMCWIYQDIRNNFQDKNAIRFEIEKGVCRVDLTQMKIYMWLDDLAISVCIGVDQIVEDDFRSVKSLCKLYYKGILIDKLSIKRSGNLLQYIDIHGGRKGRKLIQLSRNGFTQEGKLYINTVLIPRIYKNLFDVLRTLAGQKWEVDGAWITFSDKIKKNIQNSFIDKESIHQKDWQKQLIGLSLYYNFYAREAGKKKILYLSRREEEEKRQWDEAIHKVAEVVCANRSDTMDVYGKLAAVKVYADLEHNDFTVLNKQIITIADFYNHNNKFAIVSKRRDKGDKWINSLIWLENMANEENRPGFPILIDVLEKRVKERTEWKNRMDSLEDWADFLLENIGGILEEQSIQQSDCVLWLLQSVSISACFGDATGNLKIHILSGLSLGSVFYNVHEKYRLLKKMAKRKQETNAERFAGNAWMGYELLQISMVPEDVCNIKEQYIQESEVSMLFPCTGGPVQNLIQMAEKSGEDDWLFDPREDLQVKRADSYLMNIKSELIEIAEMLYSCIVIEYDQVRNVAGNSFEEPYIEYCRQERVRTSEMSFWDLLNSGYALLLGVTFREKLRDEKFKKERDSWREIFSETLKVEDLKTMIEKRLPDKDTIRILKGLVCLDILENAEFLIGNGLSEKNNCNPELIEYMNLLTKFCFDWEWLWHFAEHLQMEQKIREIKELFQTDSTEHRNLIIWVAEQVHGEPDDVAECYDRIWNELINAVICHRKEVFSEKQHFKLLDWMEKKERNME